MTVRHIVNALATLFVALLACVGSPVAAAASDSSPSRWRLEDIANLSGAEQAKLSKGEIVARDLPAGSATLRVEAAAMVVASKPADLLREFAQGGLSASVDVVLSQGEIPDGPLDDTSFAGLELPVSELDRLAAAVAGGEANLAVTEMALLADSRRLADGHGAVLRAVRHLAAERTEAYRSGGVRAIAPYARAQGLGVYPMDELAAASGNFAGLADLAAEFRAALSAFPKSVEDSPRHGFRWLLVEIRGQPTLVLSHRMTADYAEYSAMAERDFYVGRFFRARERTLGVFALADGRALVAYSSRVAIEPSAAGMESGANEKRPGKESNVAVDVLSSVRDALTAAR